MQMGWQNDKRNSEGDTTSELFYEMSQKGNVYKDNKSKKKKLDEKLLMSSG